MAPKKKLARATLPVPVPTKFHLDRRASVILAASAATDDDQLLSTAQTALWLGCSPQWLEIGRSKGYGPPFDRISPRMVRYRRNLVRAWLDQRTHTSTEDYRQSTRTSAPLKGEEAAS
jgi:hypothetical protein